MKLTPIDSPELGSRVRPSVQGDQRVAVTEPSRRTLFLHQDGVILSTILAALQEQKLVDLLLARRTLSMGEVVRLSRGNAGYLHVAFRALASQGWLHRLGSSGTPELTYSLTEAGGVAAAAFPLYEKAAQFLRAHHPVEDSVLSNPRSLALYDLAHLVDEATQDWGLAANLRQASPDLLDHMEAHLDGTLALPLFLALRNLGYLETARLSEPDTDGLAQAWRLFHHLGWVDLERGHWTEKGRLACKYAIHYGLVGSYLPMLTQLPILLFGPPGRRIHATPGLEEWHVDRRLNVLASGAAHARYFQDADDIFLDLFNREPIAAQPQFVADMGCGDGSWLKHIYQGISRHTERGRHLSRYPLLMVGVDYNKASLDVARRTLAEASVPSLVLFGDVTDPDRFAEDLRTHGLDITRGLHIRSFIDHNRQYRPLPEAAADGRRSLSSGAYVDESGQAIPNQLVEEDLVRFLRRWIPYVKTHGLVILEAHCVDPRIASRHIGELHGISFDAYHGFSHQYPVDFEVFMEAARKAGLEPVLYHHRRHPCRKPFVSISLTRFVVRAEANPVPAARLASRHTGEWQPDGSEDLRDGKALHRLLYHGGDIRRPRSWSAYSTGVLLDRAVALLGQRVDEIRKGRRSPVIAVMDYGTGTGMFAIELLKACEEAGILSQIEDLQIDLTINLLDIPSGWFAQGHALLKECPYVRFFSIRDSSGHFVPLSRIVGRKTIDLAIASMVFHLIPPRALSGVFEGLAEVLKDDGRLLWNAPDLAPPLPASDLFHEPNRRLRRRALEAIDDGARLLATLRGLPKEEQRKYADLPAQLGKVRAELTPQQRAAAERLADRQVLPTPTKADFIEGELRRVFRGEVFFRTFEMRLEDSLDAILIPANQRCLAEIEDLEVRRRLTTLLMMHDVMPSMGNGPAGTSCGFNVHWTFGEFTPHRGHPSVP